MLVMDRPRTFYKLVIELLHYLSIKTIRHFWWWYWVSHQEQKFVSTTDLIKIVNIFELVGRNVGFILIRCAHELFPSVGNMVCLFNYFLFWLDLLHQFPWRILSPPLLDFPIFSISFAF